MRELVSVPVKGSFVVNDISKTNGYAFGGFRPRKGVLRC